MSTNELKKSFKEAVKKMQTTKDTRTYYWYLDSLDDKNDWAIVLGWSDGFDEKESDSYSDGTWRLCTKLAYQSHNCIMQCDYETDWLMPYNEETNGVDDNEISIYSNTNLDQAIEYLLQCYEELKNRKNK